VNKQSDVRTGRKWVKDFCKDREFAAIDRIETPWARVAGLAALGNTSKGKKS
jgi:hypothetical protein